MKPHSAPLVLGTIADLAKGKSELLVENALLRQQLIILHRQVKRPACKKTDRFLLLFLARMLRTWKQVLFIVQPETLLRWHRELFHLFWKHKSKADSRKPKLSRERIAFEASCLSWVFAYANARSKYMRHVCPPRPRGQKWATFLQNHAADI